MGIWKKKRGICTRDRQTRQWPKRRLSADELGKGRRHPHSSHRFRAFRAIHRQHGRGDTGVVRGYFGCLAPLSQDCQMAVRSWRVAGVRLVPFSLDRYCQLVSI
jgi:hypothetical protein